jgi:threonine synthase
MWKYFDRLPLRGEKHIATLGEGGTPLVRSVNIGPSLGLDELYFKLEFQNPTGSYKDRFASVAASLMLEEKKHRMLATSSGNTGSALAAYAARFGLELELYVLENSAEQKLLQAQAFGAGVFRVKGFGVIGDITHEVVNRLRAKSDSNGHVLLISAVCVSPREMEGVKTIAYEICEQMDGPPQHVFIPVGGGGLFVECYCGFQEWYDLGKIKRLPSLHAVQPEGCATIVGPLQRGERTVRPVNCTTQISGLQVSSIFDGNEVLDKVLLTQGSGQSVSDEEVYFWQRRLIREEGIYAEPAGAAALAGVAKARQEGRLPAKDEIVCLVTGSGFKDLQSIHGSIHDPIVPLIDAGQI